MTAPVLVTGATGFVGRAVRGRAPRCRSPGARGRAPGDRCREHALGKTRHGSKSRASTCVSVAVSTTRWPAALRSCTWQQ